WNTVSPRIGVSWDASGDGRTAVKGGVSRYDRLEGITIIQMLNQRNIAFQLCPWDDTNSDLTAQMNEIAFAPCRGSLPPSLGNVDPNLARPHQWEYSAMVQRQIGGSTAVSVGYYGRRFGDLYATVNAAVPPSSYTPVSITNPLTKQPMTVYNQDPATRTAVRMVVSTVPSLEQSYNGVEFQVNTRLRRATVFGGLTIGRDHGDQDTTSSCSGCGTDVNNPNFLINNVGALGYDSTYQIRGGWTYLLPYDVQFSGSIREATGLPQSRTYNVTTADVPGFTQGTPAVQVAPRGDFRYPWQNLVDIRFVKVMKAGTVRIEPTLDVFNLFNNNAVTNAVTVVGSSLGRPSSIAMGRLVRIGGRVAF